jgi:hypothetical protein
LCLVKNTFRSPEPAGSGSLGATLLQSKREPERGSSGAFAIASLEERVMGALPEGLALLIASHEIRRRRDSFEVFGLESGFAVGGFELAIRVRPRLLLE